MMPAGNPGRPTTRRPSLRRGRCGERRSDHASSPTPTSHPSSGRWAARGRQSRRRSCPRRRPARSRPSWSSRCHRTPRVSTSHTPYRRAGYDPTPRVPADSPKVVAVPLRNQDRRHDMIRRPSPGSEAERRQPADQEGDQDQHPETCPSFRSWRASAAVSTRPRIARGAGRRARSAQRERVQPEREHGRATRDAGGEVGIEIGLDLPRSSAHPWPSPRASGTAGGSSSHRSMLEPLAQREPRPPQQVPSGTVALADRPGDLPPLNPSAASSSAARPSAGREARAFDRSSCRSRRRAVSSGASTTCSCSRGRSRWIQRPTMARRRDRPITRFVETAYSHARGSSGMAPLATRPRAGRMPPARTLPRPRSRASARRGSRTTAHGRRRRARRHRSRALMARATTHRVGMTHR